MTFRVHYKCLQVMICTKRSTPSPLICNWIAMAFMWPLNRQMVRNMRCFSINIKKVFALSAGEVVGVCGGPFLRPDSAFIGLYAVRKDFFGRKIGQKLFKSVMNYIGDRNCGLFAVPDKIELYRDRLGFKVVSNKKMVIYFGKGVLNFAENDVKLKPISEGLIDGVINYDQHIHNYRRDKLLKLSLKEPECMAFTALDLTTDAVVGYGCIRENSSNFATLSPVYANSKGIAKQLVVKLINSFEIAIKNGFFYYTIDANESAIKLAEELDLEKHEDCPLLYRTNVVEVDYSKIYSIFSPNFSH